MAIREGGATLEEAQRRLEEYRAGRAIAVDSSEVATQAARLFR